MLKLLYKTLLISVMSGSLMTINMTAFAQETTGSATAQMSKSSESNVTRDKNGVLKKTETHKFDGVESADMLASITMLATGTIAGRMLVSYRPVTNDVMIAAVGGLAFMAGEVISNVKFKKTIEDMSVEITKTNDGKKDQAQIDRLQDLKQSYEEAKKTTGTKKTMQLAAAAAFAGAAAFASYMAYQEYTLAANCKTALTASTETLNVCIKAGLTAAAAVPVGTLLVKEGLACGTCQAQLAPFSIYMKSIEAQRVSPGPSALESSQITPEQTTALLPKCVAETASGAVIAPKAGSAVNMACGAALKSEMLHQVFSYKPNASLFSDNGHSLINKILFGSQIPVVSYEQMQSKNLSGFEKISYQVLNLFLPEAEASWLPLLGLGVATTASYVLISGTLATTVDMQMFVPLNRAIAFGTLAGLSFLASKASQDQMDKLDANIVKIDQILKDMDTLQNGIKTNNVNEQQIKLAAFQANQAQEIPLNPNPAVKSDCASSMGSSNCKPLANQVANMPGFSDLPDSFKSIASQSAKLGDGLSGTNSISGSTLTTASSLAGKQNAIANLLAKTQSKLNDQLASMGKPKIDFAKEQSDLLKRLNSQTAKGLRSSGMSAGGFLSSVGGTPLSGSSAIPKIVSTGSGKNSLPPATGGGGGPGASSAKDKAFDLDFKEAAAGEGALAAGGAAPKDEKFDIGSNDINTNSGDSIFQLISNRYIKSGYPKLLEEIPVKK